MDWSDDLLALMASSDRICKHVHIPLQSGSDRILKAMRRRYRVRHYADRLERARRLMPWASIGADVMVGFPGETERDFDATRQFIIDMPFHLPPRVYLFGASRGRRRSSTETRVPPAVKKGTQPHPTGAHRPKEPCVSTVAPRAMFFRRHTGKPRRARDPRPYGQLHSSHDRRGAPRPRKTRGGRNHEMLRAEYERPATAALAPIKCLSAAHARAGMRLIQLYLVFRSRRYDEVWRSPHDDGRPRSG